MKSLILKLIFLLCVFVLVIGGIILGKRLLTPQKIHYHAGFVVFQNNKKIDFSDIRYMYLEPCSLNENSDSSPAIIQIEKAHLHDGVGDLVHIERTGAIWKDLFTNIHFPIDYSKTEGFINGQRVVGYQMKPIRDFDSLVIFIGNNNPKLLDQAVTKAYMIKMAKKSTTCGN